MNSLVTIKQYLTTAEANILKGQLNAHGIRCFLKNDSIVNTHAIFSDSAGQIDLQVIESDAQKALQLIEDGE